MSYYYKEQNPNTSEGRYNIKIAGKVRGAERARIDLEAENVARQRTVLEERANHYAMQAWPGNREGFKKIGVYDYEMDYVLSYNAEDVRRIYVAGFIEGYRGQIKEHEAKLRDLPSYLQRQHSGEVEITKAQHTEEGHLYEIEIVDKLHLEKPVKVEVLIRGDDTELRGLDDDA